MKTCCICFEYKSESEFYPDKRLSEGLSSRCRSCSIKKATEWYEQNPGRQYRARLKRVYGLTDDECEALSDRCEICGSQKRLNVDHDHNFGFVRGVLCNNCNKALGVFKHDPELLERAIRYLEGTLAQTPTSPDSSP